MIVATKPASRCPEEIDGCYGSCHTAGHLEQSERDILNLRSQQGRFEERVAMMQGLLKVSEKQECIALTTSIIVLHAGICCNVSFAPLSLLTNP